MNKLRFQQKWKNVGLKVLINNISFHYFIKLLLNYFLVLLGHSAYLISLVIFGFIIKVIEILSLIEENVSVFVFFHFKIVRWFLITSKSLFLNFGIVDLFDKIIVKLIPFLAFFYKGIIMTSICCTCMYDRSS
jgi:hypothetical protein